MPGEGEVESLRSASPAPLAFYLEYWLRFVSNQASYAFGRLLEAEGVTVAEWTMLRELYGEGTIAPGRLANRLGLTPSAISKLAERLDGKALVVRHFHPDHTRTHSLSLSDAGRALVPRLGVLADQSDAMVFGHIGAEGRGQLKRILTELAEHRGRKPMVQASLIEPPDC